MTNNNPKHRDFSGWLQKEFETHSPPEVFDQAKKLLSRLDAGWPIEKALTKAVRYKKPMV